MENDIHLIGKRVDMKITEVSIPKTMCENGLQGIKMYKLQSIVILAGKNGSGKSRILDTVKRVISKKPKKSHIEGWQKNIASYEHNIMMASKQQAALLIQTIKAKDSPTLELNSRQIENLEISIKTFRDSTEQTKHLLSWDLIKTDTVEKEYNLVYYVPRNLSLTDPNNYSKSALLDEAKKIESIGTEKLSTGSLSKIQSLQDRWHKATHQDSLLSQAEREEIVKEYNNLKEIVKLFLNTDIFRNADGEATVFGLPIGKAKLSDGQKVLIQYCMAIHCQGHSLDVWYYS